MSTPKDPKDTAPAPARSPHDLPDVSGLVVGVLGGTGPDSRW